MKDLEQLQWMEANPPKINEADAALVAAPEEAATIEEAPAEAPAELVAPAVEEAPQVEEEPAAPVITLLGNNETGSTVVVGTLPVEEEKAAEVPVEPAVVEAPVEQPVEVQDDPSIELPA